MSKKEIIDIVENEVHFVMVDEKVELDSTNWIVKNGELLRAKQDVLNKAIIHLSNDLVNVKPHYPVDDKMEFDLTTRFVIINKEDFLKIKNHILYD